MATGGAAVRLYVCTKKGLWTLTSGADRIGFELEGPEFLGHIVNHAVLDPRDGRTLLVAARTGHLGQTIFRSSDRGTTWKEATRPPAFPKAEGGADPSAFLGSGQDVVKPRRRRTFRIARRRTLWSSSISV
jgi:hypothetical protein